MTGVCSHYTTTISTPTNQQQRIVSLFINGGGYRY